MVQALPESLEVTVLISNREIAKLGDNVLILFLVQLRLQSKAFSKFSSGPTGYKTAKEPLVCSVWNINSNPWVTVFQNKA